MSAPVVAPVGVSVVICAYTEARWDQTYEAVRSCLRQDPPPYEVVLVVDHNPPLATRLRHCFGPEIAIVENSHALGLSGARNTGIEHCSGDVVAFLDDDAYAAPGWIEGHARHYRDPDVLGVGGSIVPAWAGERPSWFPTEFDWVVGCTYAGLPDDVRPVRNPIGANMSFRRDALLAVEGFTEHLGRVGRRPLGCEETEVSIRAQRLVGGSSHIVFDPAVVVNHHVPLDRSRFGYFARRCWSEGVSKASVAHLVGSSAATASERSYVLHTLPLAVRRDLAAALLEPRALVRAGAIVLGLAVTSGGYASGRASRALAPARGRRVVPMKPIELHSPV